MVVYISICRWVLSVSRNEISSDDRSTLSSGWDGTNKKKETVPSHGTEK